MKPTKMTNILAKYKIFNKDLAIELLVLFDKEKQKFRDTIDQYSEELDAQDKVIDQAKVISKIGSHRRTFILNADELELLTLRRLLKELTPQPMDIKSIEEALVSGKTITNKLFSISLKNIVTFSIEVLKDIITDPSEWSIIDD